MRDLSNLVENRIIIPDKLIDYGFNHDYIFEKILSQPNFKAVITYENDTLTARVIDLELDEDYVLVDVKTPIGRFAAELKMEYESIIEDIIDKCTRPHVFKFPQSKRLMKYVENKFGCDLEFLWKKFPKDAIYRNKFNNKWFALLVALDKTKIGLEGEGEIEIVVLKHDNASKVIDGEVILQGYHMNKKYWITIPLDERIGDGELFRLVENSYSLIS
ncbi:MmcQ/YjbR family DNA-binding protein [Methanobrevibacter sp.]|uniref:MmcQ/YjbR family DNA-binding protein n=1 Tax=Methanobrevibacter sp. TaxID=66852 RepID=UPI0025EE12EE|nr:MmcQ/YjbR family DNA-binding protein [Methanobrevibacter sp.]MBQ6098378.1 MmcQ/YjbR family DNA-binding protein [Methanobrevibacter sp.]MBQ6513072.1 MmcQ/YjbR family DNA-binding protein [Methanobrevibacter sp.]